LPYTIQLTIAATVVGVVLGIPLGVVSARHRGRAIDDATRVFALLGYAIPDFYLGAIFLIYLSLDFGLFPIDGTGSGFFDQMHHLVLPAVTLGLVKAAFLLTFFCRSRSFCLGSLSRPLLGPGFWNLVMALVLAFAARFARIARASTLSIRNEPFVEAASSNTATSAPSFDSRATPIRVPCCNPFRA
jgi:ABC-type dipeptide/oligopeptide/nickel transport system permease component